MSVEQVDKVDMMGIDVSSGKVILTISDHLDWDNEDDHLIILQNKINRYLAFIESGEMLSVYPKGADRIPVISIVARLPLPPAGADFLVKARSVIEPTGIELEHKVLEE